MKTTLPTKIETTEEAKKFLTDLHNNKEDFHPEDDAHDIIWFAGTHIPSKKELDKLNELMEACYKVCDPCEILVNLYA